MAEAEASPAPFLSAPPAGFVEATAAVSRLPPAELEGIALQVTRFVLQRNGSLSLADLAERTAPTMGEFATSRPRASAAVASSPRGLTTAHCCPRRGAGKGRAEDCGARRRATGRLRADIHIPRRGEIGAPMCNRHALAVRMHQHKF